MFCFVGTAYDEFIDEDDEDDDEDDDDDYEKTFARFSRGSFYKLNRRPIASADRASGNAVQELAEVFIRIPQYC